MEHNPTMSSLRHNSLESHSKNPQCKHVWSTNMTCPEMIMVVQTYQVCALTMIALSQNFRVVVLGNYLHCNTVRLQLTSINVYSGMVFKNYRCITHTHKDRKANLIRCFRFLSRETVRHHFWNVNDRISARA